MIRSGEIRFLVLLYIFKNILNYLFGLVCLLSLLLLFSFSLLLFFVIYFMVVFIFSVIYLDQIIILRYIITLFLSCYSLSVNRTLTLRICFHEFLFDIVGEHVGSNWR